MLARVIFRSIWAAVFHSCEHLAKVFFIFNEKKKHPDIPYRRHPCYESYGLFDKIFPLQKVYKKNFHFIKIKVTEKKSFPE